MARARNIKPGFFLNTDLAEIPPIGRLAFIGMWTIADYKGCIEGNFRKIKAQVLPYDNCDIEEVANYLEQYGFIRYYSVQGKLYIKITNFEAHQNPHKNEREAGSKIPDIQEADENQPNNNKLQEYGTSTEQVRKLDGNARADSLLLIPDSLCTTASAEADADFEDAWSIYPKRAGSNPKGKALKAWSARRRAGDSAEDMKAGVIRYAKFARDTGKEHTEFVMQAVKFFGPDRHFAEPWNPPNQERKAANWWDDDQATLAKGREFGLEPRSGEDWRAFKARINERLRVAA